MCLCATTNVLAEELTTYLLKVQLDPEQQRIEVDCRVRLTEAQREAGGVFELSSVLEITSAQPALQKLPSVAGQAHRYQSSELGREDWLELKYSGNFDFGLSDQKEEYTRGFRETAGTLSAAGVYLSGASLWVPKFDDGLITFDMEVASPETWHVISEGEGSSGANDGRAHWNSEGASEEIYLVGGPLQRWSDRAGSIETHVYLHADDEALANKYLAATGRYIEMYSALLGAYPYSKFALVENFWETGYGMPSFTLLGEQVIRFPFILHSSYPHEILHNWWGNSVFVDYESGNWCEGLTAYLADHLIQEQRGEGALYRRSALQKYRDYVKEGRDFPLREFRSRHSAATEAVGYGKSLMFFHMLRRMLGDADFTRGLADFYRTKRGQRASFEDIGQALGRANASAWGGDQVGREAIFGDWLDRAGAAQLALEHVHVERDGAEFVLCFEVVQTQPGEPFLLMNVPYAVVTAAGETKELSFAMDQPRCFVRCRLDAEPVAFAVDPEFDVFRLLDPRETPPSIGQIFGEAQILALLPSAANETERAMYSILVEGWISAEHNIEVQLDSDVDALPSDRAVWVLGAANRFATFFDGWRERANEVDGGGNALLAADGARPANHSTVVVERHPAQLEKAVGWIVLDPTRAMDGLMRKLPHYGKYSFLAFEGEEPTNVLKGQWPALDSPLVQRFAGGAPSAFSTKERRALAEYPAAFSERKLREHVEWLAAPEREGRGLGSAGLGASADYIAQAFEAIGLEPAGDAGTWFQEFEVQSGPGGKPVRSKNVIGLLRGTRADWQKQSVVLSAHYDHLGFGWPDVHAGDEGELHAGANDNASGVAALIELAANMAEGGAGSRSLLFIAFSAEESGLLGSRHYAEHPSLPLEDCLGVMNMDAVGVLGEQAIQIHGTGTAYEWQHIFRGCGFVTGIDSRNVSANAEASDQWSFIEKGVPGVQIFTGIPEHYHRPSDVPATLDYPGLVQVCTFMQEALRYMVEREEPFQITIEGVTRVDSSAQPARRGVSFGSIPEYGFDGGGMLLSGVSAGSPAEKAGLLAGDILIRIDEHVIENTRGFAEVLKTLTAGQVVRAVVLRAGAELSFEVTLVGR